MRPSTVLRRLATLALLLVLVPLTGRTGRAEEEDPSPWLARGTYENMGLIASGSTYFHVWRLRTPDPDGEEPAVDLAPVLTILRADEGVVRQAYDVAPVTTEGPQEVLSIRQRLEPDESPGARIAESPGPLTADVLIFAQRLATELLAVEQRWLEGVERLAAASRSAEEGDGDAARRLLREGTRSLERAHQVAAWHMGIVGDLLTAYQLLLPYEVGTDRGANVSFLWRAACVRWLGGAPSEEERARAVLCQLNCAFAEGCYPLAADLVEHPVLAGRDDVQPVREALAALGQSEVAKDVLPPVSGSGGAVDVQALTCPAEPGAGDLAWHRRVYLTQRPEALGPPLPVWFSLTLEGERGARRWALIGWVGSSRRLLRLYGAQEPEAAAVDEFVAEVMRQSANGGGAR